MALYEKLLDQKSLNFSKKWGVGESLKSGESGDKYKPFYHCW